MGEINPDDEVGHYEIIHLDSISTQQLYEPFTISGSCSDHDNGEHTFTLWINNNYIAEQTINDYEFSFDYPNLNYLGWELNIVVTGSRYDGKEILQDTFIVAIDRPSLSESIYDTYSLLKNILEEDFYIDTSDTDGLISLINKVEGL